MISSRNTRLKILEKITDKNYGLRVTVTLDSFYEDSPTDVTAYWTYDDNYGSLNEMYDRCPVRVRHPKGLTPQLGLLKGEW